MKADDRLERFFAADAPPAIDRLFDSGVMQSIARRRLRARLVRGGALSAVIALLGWSLAPVLSRMAETAGPALIPAAAILTLTFSLIALARPHLRRM